MSLHLPEHLVAALANVRSAGVITGPGLSAESGLRAHFRDHEVYDDPPASDPLSALGSHSLDVDPARVVEVLRPLAEAAMAAEPNAGHRAIHALAGKLARFTLMTQNVDGLHERAGDQNPILVYGDLFTLECVQCRRTFRYEGAADAWQGPHTCDGCGADKFRPEVALFGEYLTTIKVLRIGDGFTHDPPDLLLLVGLPTAWPWVVQPLQAATAKERLTVEVSERATDLSGQVDFSLRGKASDWLPLIEAAIPAK
ncbi:MAG: Sir2 family NAD-dependent protein deacetylase [Planctomycetota bacterium]